MHAVTMKTDWNKENTPVTHEKGGAQGTQSSFDNNIAKKSPKQCYECKAVKESGIEIIRMDHGPGCTPTVISVDTTTSDHCYKVHWKNQSSPKSSEQQMQDHYSELRQKHQCVTR